jgi:hypothetical protein
LSHIESIASIPSLKNNTHDQEKVRFNSSYYHFFNLDELGVQLEGIAKTLKTNEKTSLLFNAENHLMAFDIQKKSVRDGPPVYIIKFYDPNITDKHIRIVCEDLLMLKKLSIHDLMSEAQSDAYFPKIKSAFFYSPKQCIGNEKPEIVVDEDNPPDGSLCYFLEMGLLQHHQEVIKQLIDSTTLSSKQKLNALNAKKADGMSGLCIALQNDHIDTIKCYMDSILESSIKSSNKVRLLAAKNKAGYPVLYPALLYCLKCPLTFQQTPGALKRVF